jgi:hypothetical protein
MKSIAMATYHKVIKARDGLDYVTQDMAVELLAKRKSTAACSTGSSRAWRIGEPLRSRRSIRTPREVIEDLHRIANESLAACLSVAALLEFAFARLGVEIATAE